VEPGEQSRVIVLEHLCMLACFGVTSARANWAVKAFESAPPRATMGSDDPAKTWVAEATGAQFSPHFRQHRSPLSRLKRRLSRSLDTYVKPHSASHPNTHT
jgi:hypothetical protein